MGSSEYANDEAASVRNYIAVIDASVLKTNDEIQESFAEQLHLPSFYGKNLAALSDVLSERTHPTKVVLLCREGIENPDSYIARFAKVCLRESLANEFVSFSVVHTESTPL